MLNALQYVPELAHLTMVDLDTVEVSNLSRQYIFTAEDVGKAKVAACARFMARVRPDVEVVSLVRDVTSDFFTVGFIGQFDYVLNALDNLAARKAVSNLVFVHNLIQRQKPQDAQKYVTLIDIGTEGLGGSVSFHRNTEKAFVCCRTQTKAEPIPVCTLRSKPTQFKHCVAFARYLLERVFGGAGNELTDFAPLRECEDGVEAQIAHDWKKIDGDASIIDAAVQNAQRAQDHQKMSLEDANYSQENVLTRDECVSIFAQYYFQALHNSALQRWDKDNATQRLFVCAVATVRAAKFNIQPQSPFEAAALADRIVPAISFSNGLVGSLAVRLMQGKPEEDIMYLTGQGKYTLLKDKVGGKSSSCDFCTKRFLFVHTGLLASYCLENSAKAYLNNVQVAGARDDEELSDWFGEEKREYEEPCDRIIAALDANKELFYIYVGE